MKTRFALVFVSSLLCAAGCSDELEDEPGTGTGSYPPIAWCTADDFERPELELVAIEDTRAPGSPGFEDVLDGEVIDNPTACDCSDDACVIGWIEETMGCGVCVQVSCGDDEAIGGCLPCPQPTPSQPDVVVSPCALAPVETNPPAWDISRLPS